MTSKEEVPGGIESSFEVDSNDSHKTGQLKVLLELQFQTGRISALRLNGRCVEHYTLVLYKFERKDSAHGSLDV